MTALVNQDRREATSELIHALTRRDIDAVRGMFDGPADIDDPFAGHQREGGFEALATDWRPIRDADVLNVRTTSSTSCGRFTANELTISIQRDGQQVDLPVVVIAEFGDLGKLLKSRIYYRRAWIDGKQHHRWPILEAEPHEQFNQVITEYQQALSDGNVERMMATFGPDFHFDGHGQAKDLDLGIGMGRYDRQETRTALTQMFGLNPQGGTKLEHLNVIQDETTTVLEFNLHQGVPQDPQIRAHAGVAAYEMGEDGLIKEARIYDEAW